MSIVFNIGLVVTGMLAKYFVGENWITSTIASKGIENLIERGEGAIKKLSKKDSDEIKKICDRIMKNILPVVKAEYGNGDFSPVFLEFTNSIGSLELTSELLVDLNFDNKLLLQHIKTSLINKKSVRARSAFSEKEESLYNDLLRSFCREINRVAFVLNDYEITVSRKQLANQGKILSILQSIYDRPTKADKEFEEMYCSELSKQLDKLEMFGIRRVDDVARQQKLSIAYTTIEVEQRAAYQSAPAGSALRIGGKFKNTSLRNLSVDKLLQEGKRLLVVGDPGSGKTTLLKWIAIQISNGVISDKRESQLIPFFIRLRECVETGLPNVEDFPKQALKMLSGKTSNWVHRILVSGRGVVLIDGVDEMPVSSRKELLNSLAQLVSAYPLSRYIITSRPSAVRENTWVEWKEWIEEERFARASMQPMSKNQIGVFISKWFAALDASSLSEVETHDIDGLKRLLKTRSQLFRLATNPLLCAMICALYKDRGETLPSERIQLYSECVEMLLQRRDEVRKIRMDDYKDLLYSRKITIVQDLSWWMMQNNYSDVDIDKAEQYLDKELFDMGMQNIITSKEVSTFLIERTGLLREETIGKISFAHRTFQEYLAAQSAVSHFYLDFLLSMAKDDQWRETIILACGEARPKERGEFLSSLIKLSKDSRKEDKKRNLALLALSCLETCTTIEPAEIRQQVLNYAMKFFPPQDLSEVQSVARAGDLATSLLFYDPKYSPKTKTYCINALSQIGTSSALLVLTDYASDMAPAVAKTLMDARRYFNEADFKRTILKKIICFVFQGIEDVSLLDQAESLIYIDISHSFVSDLSILRKHSELQYLNIRETLVRDLSPLVELSKIQFLDIRGTKIINLRPLSKLKSLRTLVLDTKVVYDVSVLSALPNLDIVRKNSTVAGEEAVDFDW